MANRHLSRSLVVQTLFEWDFNSLPPIAVHVILDRNQREFAPGLEDDTFIKQLVDGIIERQKEIDQIIVKAAPEWPFDKISMIDRNVLRVGLFELLFSDRKEVPARVAINEAIELAKTFGGESSGKFVNGVLGTVYKEMGEPGKNDVPAKKRRTTEARYEDLAVETLGGAVVYARRPEDSAIFLAFVHDIFGYWTLSKGHIEENEEVKVATIRGVKKEMGLPIEIKDELGTNEYVASHPEKGKIRKRVCYYLAESPYQTLHLEEGKGGLDDARWFPVGEILDLKMYDDILPFVTKAMAKLSNDERSA